MLKCCIFENPVIDESRELEERVPKLSVIEKRPLNFRDKKGFEISYGLSKVTEAHLHGKRDRTNPKGDLLTVIYHGVFANTFKLKPAKSPVESTQFKGFFKKTNMTCSIKFSNDATVFTGSATTSDKRDLKIEGDIVLN